MAGEKSKKSRTENLCKLMYGLLSYCKKLMNIKEVLL